MISPKKAERTGIHILIKSERHAKTGLSAWFSSGQSVRGCRTISWSEHGNTSEKKCSKYIHLTKDSYLKTYQ